MADPIWLEDQLVGVKKGPDLAKKLNAIPVVGQAVETVNTVVGLIPANVTTTVETTLDAAALAEIRTIALGTLNWTNSKLAAAGLPTQEISELDSELAIYLKNQTGGELDLTSQFPGTGTGTSAAVSLGAKSEPAPGATDASSVGSEKVPDATDNGGGPAMDLSAGNNNNPIFSN